MDFTRINQVGLLDSVRPLKRLAELELGKEYYITGMRIAETKWGTRVVVDVDSAFTCMFPAHKTRQSFRRSGRVISTDVRSSLK